MAYYFEKIISWLFYALVFLLPLQTRLFIVKGQLNDGWWEYGTISIYLTDLLLLILLLLAGVYFWQTRLKPADKEFRLKFIWFLIAGFDLALFLSIFLAFDKILALFHYFWFLLAIGFFWLITNFKYNQLVFIYSFLAGVFCQAVLAIIQFLTQTSFANSWLGLAGHQAGALGVSVVETYAGRWLRAYGGLDHPNILGGLLVVAIILTLSLLARDKLKYQRLAILNYFFLLIFSAALFFSFSRSAWLGLAVGLAAMFVLNLKNQALANKKRVIAGILAVSGLFLVLGIVYKNIVFVRFNSSARLEIKSQTQRAQLLEQSFSLLKKHFLFGAGIGNYTLAVFKQINSQAPSWWYQPVHNTFLLVWAETGLFGFLFFISLLFYLGFRKYKNKSRFNYSFAFWPLLIALIIMLNFDHWWWSLHFGVLFFWFCLGVLAKD